MKERQFDCAPGFHSDSGHFRFEDIFSAPGNDVFNFAIPDGDLVAHVALQHHATTNVTSTAGAATFNGSVAVDANGDALFNFNVSGSKMSPADYYAVWTGAGSATASTAPAFAAPIDYHDSVASYVDPARDAVGRWGDYSTAVADPAHANGFYVSNEFDNGTVVSLTGVTYSSWGTTVAHILV